MTVKLILTSVSCDLFDLATWQPRSLEEVHCGLTIKVGFQGGDGTNIFYGSLATPEALRARARTWLLASRTKIIISNFDYALLVSTLTDIVEGCSRETWDEGCLALSRYFEWEYEDYVSADDDPSHAT